jgi:hypothetical protein
MCEQKILKRIIPLIEAILSVGEIQPPEAPREFVPIAIHVTEILVIVTT